MTKSDRTKRCCKCKVLKILSDEFYRRAALQKDGYRPRCKECMKKAEKKKTYPPKIVSQSTELIEHIETLKLLGCHRTMDVFPTRCHYRFGTTTPCMKEKEIGNYCEAHSNIRSRE